jgi:hypothetical protein
MKRVNSKKDKKKKNETHERERERERKLDTIASFLIFLR